ncbi:hypothetical protein [Acuticoccus sp. I52.16.1]|uniref:SGNH/GDSL hydrolase family protein n=1 Tax=Acuticoccus sp. I52.16.1 TaxID=2928472 RepID=UPI001FD50648|nr:hypothetical protein [Acuticoccus sp. I52.16.1]UOM36766.1 hypothetical protein MRB58_11525 [Acuticoccus sp. I52.16.1]
MGFHISPVWSTLVKLKLHRCVLGAIISILCIEAVARVAPHIVAKTVHQPFATTTTRGLEGVMVEWRVSEVGARGSLRRPGLLIATFGTSTTAAPRITQAQSWPELLKAQLCGAVHVDNFARDGAGPNDIAGLLKDLAARGRHYDVLTIMSWMFPGERMPPGNPFHHWSAYDFGKAPFAAPVLFVRAIRRELHEAEERLTFLHRLLELTRNLRRPSPPGFRHPPSETPENRELRASGIIDFVDRPNALTPEEGKRVRARTEAIVRTALTVSPHVFFLVQPVAFDENELPGVAARWFSLFPAREDQPVYLSNRSVAERIRSVQTYMREGAEAAGATIVPLDEIMRPMLSQTDTLFFDRWHFAPDGHALAAQTIAPYVRTALPALADMACCDPAGHCG